jgi:hypothetical protein
MLAAFALADRRTELAHALPERAGKPWQAPGPEHEQCDDTDEQEMQRVLEAHLA